LATEYGLELGKCVFVGDALTDYYAAKETGTSFIGVNGLIDFPLGTKAIEDCSKLEAAIHTLLSPVCQCLSTKKGVTETRGIGKENVGADWTTSLCSARVI
jgi:beta-phosphoglucomutase-like phosphatase (HAD superfamily)